MTFNDIELYKQAIDNFKLEQRLINEDIDNTDEVNREQDEHNINQFIFRMIAINSIKLQIPKVISKEEIKEYVDIDKNILGHFTQCPNCKQDIVINKNTNYCQCCGQSLKFE